MSDPTGPCWTVTYRRADGTEDESLTIIADGMVWALKQAQMQLRALKVPFHITGIAEAPLDPLPSRP